MANPRHVATLLKGVPHWNRWRVKHPEVHPDLSGFSARALHDSILGLNLEGANFTNADLRSADLYRCWLVNADFSGADLRGAVLGEVTAGGASFRRAKLRAAVMMKGVFSGADFRGADFVTLPPEVGIDSSSPAGFWWTKPALLNGASMENCNLRGAKLCGSRLDRVDLTEAKLTRADLREATLEFVQMVRTDVAGADFHGCSITGLTAFDLRGRPLDETQLRIATARGEPVVVDFLEAAQFVPLLSSERLGHALDCIAPKVVLILGRFSRDRKPVLDALRAALTARGWVALVFDFPAPKGITQTFKVLASLVGWVIADVTEATEVRREITHFAEQHRAVPIRPILQGRRAEWFGLDELRDEGANVAATFRYRDTPHLLASLDEALVKPTQDALAQPRRPRMEANR